MARKKTTKAKAAHKRDAKISVRITKELFERFTKSVREIGLRRDQYLDDVLDMAADILEGQKGGSARGGRLAHIVFDNKAEETAQVSLRLRRDLVERISSLCEDKNLPRDLFFEAAFEDLCHALDLAIDRLSDPYTHILDNWETAFKEYLYTDDDVDEILEAAGKGQT
jgi:hypothetical protein